MATVYIDNVSAASGLPEDDALTLWCKAALGDVNTDAELSLRIVDDPEMHELNLRYRGKDRSTNVLSFPAELPDGIDIPLLGDIVICAPVVASEATEQHKSLTAHWAHMVVHGTLHLRGYDHIDEDEALAMEALETHILTGLGFPAPYDTQQD